MGNALCGIVPTDMVCHTEDQNNIENEKNLICLKHYNSQIVDKKIGNKEGISLMTSHYRNRPDNEGSYKPVAISMPVEYAIERNDRPPYSLNEQNICVT